VQRPSVTMMNQPQGSLKPTKASPKRPKVTTKKSKPATKQMSKPVQKPSKSKKVVLETLSFRTRLPADDAYIIRLTEEELGEIHLRAFGEPFPREQFLRYIQSGAPTILIEKGNKTVGYYSYLIGQDGKMHISALVIDQEHQQDGLGTRVMQQIETEAAVQGIHTLEVFVQANNERSIAFTRKLGFQPVYDVPPNSVCFHKAVRAQVARPASAGEAGEKAQTKALPNRMAPQHL